MDEVALIEKVYEHECLYNTNATHYRDQTKRQEAWEEIGSEMETSASVVKNAWIKLRNCYINALKRRRIRSSQGGKKMVAWKYETEMSYLLPFIDTRQSNDNLELDDSLQYIKVEEHDVEDEECAMEDYQLKEIIAKRIKTNPTQEIQSKDDLDKRKNKEEYKQHNSINANTLDETDMFYLSMAKTVKRLPLMDQVKIRMDLCRMVSEAELRKINFGTE